MRFDMAIAKRILELRKRGFLIALNDTVLDDELMKRVGPLLPYFSYIKIDVQRSPKERFHDLLKRIRAYDPEQKCHQGLQPADIQCGGGGDSLLYRRAQRSVASAASIRQLRGTISGAADIIDPGGDTASGQTQCGTVAHDDHIRPVRRRQKGDDSPGAHGEKPHGAYARNASL